MNSRLELEFGDSLDARHAAIEHHLVDGRSDFMHRVGVGCGVRCRRGAEERKQEQLKQRESSGNEVDISHGILRIEREIGPYHVSIENS